MGNCLSKIPEGGFQLNKKVMADRALYKKKAYIRGYDDLQALGLHVQKRVCKTSVADRFPPQAHDLEWDKKVSRHIDTIAKNKERNIWR